MIPLLAEMMPQEVRTGGLLPWPSVWATANILADSLPPICDLPDSNAPATRARTRGCGCHLPAGISLVAGNALTRTPSIDEEHAAAGLATAGAPMTAAS